MSIWFKTPALDDINQFAKNTLVEHLDIRFVEIGDDYLKATMPVDRRTHQPMGFLHGGASVVLAETLASVGANICVDPSKHYCLGLEINANHIRPVRDCFVTGISKPVHMGRSTQIWEVRIFDGRNHLSCISRVTMAVRSYKRNLSDNPVASMLKCQGNERECCNLPAEMSMQPEEVL